MRQEFIGIVSNITYSVETGRVTDVVVKENKDSAEQWSIPQKQIFTPESLRLGDQVKVKLWDDGSAWLLDKVIVESQSSPSINISNVNTNTNTNINGGLGRKVNKVIYLVLVVTCGMLGVHKFYAGKIFMGVLYALTGGLLGFGILIDLLSAAFKKADANGDIFV